VSSDEKYEIRKDIEASGIVIGSTTEPKIDVKITLTSPVMRAAGGKRSVYSQASRAYYMMVGWFMIGWSLFWNRKSVINEL
jgi:hypothetical protein